MHFYEHSNDQIFLNQKPSVTQQRKIQRTSDKIEAKATENERTTEQRDDSDTEECSRTTTVTNITDSTDSGVNLSDNDDIPPPSPQTSSSHPFNSHTTLNDRFKQFHESNKIANRDNNVNNYESNNNEIVISSNKNNIVNYNNDDENSNINSEKFDKHFKVSDNRKASNSTRYQHHTQKDIESKNAIDTSQKEGFKTETILETPPQKSNSIPTTRKEISDKPSSQHNEFIHLQKRPLSAISSLSMSSKTNSSDNNQPSSIMHHCKGSPVVSIRSITSTIVTSDSDSDSDLNSDADNYVIKKLGTQVTYSPNDSAIPNISSGHTVVNQKIVTTSSEPPLPPLEALAVIGDQIGAAQALGPVASVSGVSQRPQIGSIALSNSNDVTFGDKHFYEGPVTIQQFLIDSRDKWKESNGRENPVFESENAESSVNNAKDKNSDAEKSSNVYKYILKRKKTIIPGVLAFTALLIVVTVWGSKMLNESKNTTSNNNNSGEGEECDGNGTLCLINRDIWRAHPRKGTLDKQKMPLHRVVISHTASEPCDSIMTCAARVRVIQEFHMNSFGWDDIGYNFLISSDGRVYVGRGWDYVGAHTKGYNYDSVGITFIGTYISIEPSEAQLNACLALLEEGVRLEKLAPDFRLYGARQLGATESPGEKLYMIIRKWKHWSSNIEPT